MTFVGSFLLIIEILIVFKTIGNANCVNASTNNTANICYREETYIEQIKVPVQQPVRVRTSNWCLEFPPRCSNYKTEIREFIKMQNVTKTRTIEFCCEGYARITTGNDTVCRPICRGGCGRGYCHAPNQCSCDVGFTGSHCTERCAHDRWGQGCRNTCKCQNGAGCDIKTGFCLCTEGWMGEMCEQSCPNGFYGVTCRSICNCSSNKCHPQTGECFPEEVTFIKLVSTDTPIINTTNTLNKRINLLDWLGVPTNKSNFIENSNYHILTNESSTSSVIETLNSTLANLTENIDKLAKNLVRQSESVTLLVPNPVVEITTIKTIQEVIFIKPDTANPSIIVHQPTVFAGKDEPTNTISKQPEVIRVITNWHQPLKETPKANNTETSNNSIQAENNLTAVTSALAVFSVVVFGTASVFVIMYRKYFIHSRQSDSAASREEVQKTKTLTKPLPDLPAFTQNFTKSAEGKIKLTSLQALHWDF